MNRFYFLKPVTENEFSFCPKCTFLVLRKTHQVGDGTVAHGYYCPSCGIFFGGNIKFTNEPVIYKEALNG